MQVYMLGSGLERALYFPVCKNDDRVEPERVRLDKPYAEGMVKRAQEIAVSDVPEWETSFVQVQQFSDKKPVVALVLNREHLAVNGRHTPPMQRRMRTNTPRPLRDV